MKNIFKAKEILKSGSFTCVLINGEKEYTSFERGVKPLLNWYHSGDDFTGFCAADKVVGKAAAFLYVLLGVKSVHAGVISKLALEVLEQNEIEASFDKLVPAIRNRTNTGFCPMETATKDITEPIDAVKAIENTINALAKK